MRIESSYNSDLSEAQIKAMKRSGQMECETCKNRKYKDGSDEANVSYKGATHIDPSGAASKVMAHEQEHVLNAYRKASSKDGEVTHSSEKKLSEVKDCFDNQEQQLQQVLAHIEHANDLGTTKSSMFEDMNNLVAQLSPMAKDIEKNYR